MAIRFPALVAGALMFMSAPYALRAQLVPFNVKYNSGQNVQPIFEGWWRNPDGSFTMHFGYLNRNYVEELHVPVGPANQVEPLGPDGSQPTYFYTRTHRYAFSVTVPKDWDKKRELVWTVTANGATDKAYAWLQPDWEIDRDVLARNSTGAYGSKNPNEPPVLKVDAVAAVTLSAPATLTALVTDDGLPKPGTTTRKVLPGQETPPTLQNMPAAPVNVPQVQGGGQRGRRSAPPAGLSVSWIVWRGPAGVVFGPAEGTPVKDGKAVTTASFTKPGEYVLRARATDGLAVVTQDVKVTVGGGSTAGQAQPKN